MLNALIVEDEIKAQELLQKYLRQIDFISLIGTLRDPLQAFPFLQEHQVDVLFLDINMPVLSGVELYGSLRNPPAVIFTTAHPEYAVEGFNLEAVDYLLKPITFPRFLKACEKLRKQQKTNSPTPYAHTTDFADIIYVKSGPITHKMSWKEIIYLEKDENYVIFHTAKKRILSRQTLSDLEDTFPHYFCRVHKSYAVSLLHVQQLERELIQMPGKTIPVGRTFRGRLLDGLNNL